MENVTGVTEFSRQKYAIINRIFTIIVELIPSLALEMSMPGGRFGFHPFNAFVNIQKITALASLGLANV